MKTLFESGTYLTAIIAVAGSGLAACDQQTTKDESVEPAAEAIAPEVVDLKAIDREAGSLAREEGLLAAYSAFFAEDGIQLDDGKEMIDEGLLAIMEDYENIPKGTSVSWVPMGGGVAESGELGYTWGRWSNVVIDENGIMVDTYGKYVTIWKKQQDGSWKIALDIWNSEDSSE
jgi:ketosteroid isomerase-like protein